jgi:tetratricopeptide (TPR) repeat protein
MDYYHLMLPRSCLVALLLAAAAGVQAQDTPPAPPARSALSSELFYQLLLGELSVRNDDPGTGFSLILDAARKTGDPRLFQRAVDLALQARAGESALQAARAWKQALPTSRDANRYVLQILVGLNRTAEALEPLKRELALAGAKERLNAIATLPLYFTRASDKKLVASVVEQALAEYLNQAATGAVAWSVLGRLRLEAGDAAGALAAARRGQAVDPQAEGPALLALTLMSPERPQAEAIVRKHLEGQPRMEVRMEYARRLLDTQRYTEADAQLHQITSARPEFAEAWLIQGLLDLQDNKLAAAETAIKRYLALMGLQAGTDEQDRGLVQAYLALAQIAEQRKNFDEAESWLGKIDSTQDMVRVQHRRAGMLARQGRIDEARQLIRSLPERTPADARLKISTEVQLLREHKLYQAAYDLLADALRRQPDDPDLLYDQAALADRLGQPEEMERLLRRVIALKPDYHHAYNALGYALAERNIRLDEARQLILKALEFAPGDPFISDSLAWVEFRSGKPAEALRLLQAAFKAKPDAEIAAHLGEVLWSQGAREQAIQIWKEGLLLNAENETLLGTLKRLQVKP